MRKWKLLLKTILSFVVKPSRSYFSVVEEVYKKELSKMPNDPYLLWFLGNIYVRYKKYKEAEILIESLYFNGSVNKALVLILSKIYFNLQKYDRVVEMLEDYEQLYEKDLHNYYIGYSLTRLERFGDAVKYLQNYVKHFQKEYIGFVTLGYAYYMDKVYDRALLAYQQAEKLNPQQEIKEKINLCNKKIEQRRSVN